jgi:hypothetical protein
VRLLSRSTVPAQSIGAFVDDRRRLGVQIEALVLWQGLDGHVIPAASLAGAGWHELEDTLRWSDGNAELDLPAADGDDSFLELVVAATLAYPVEQPMATLRRAA